MWRLVILLQKFTDVSEERAASVSKAAHGCFLRCQLFSSEDGGNTPFEASLLSVSMVPQDTSFQCK
jgi:hypothetical protein